MFHNEIAQRVRSDFSTGARTPERDQAGSGLRLVTAGESLRRSTGLRRDAPKHELLAIAARRCSSFFAEAAVLVLVFGILDLFMLKGRIESGWVAGSLAISVLLLVASVATEFSARRWLGAQP